MGRVRRTLRWFVGPAMQMLVAVAGVLGGAALIGRFALGLAIVLVSVGIAADGLFRNIPAAEAERAREIAKTTHEDVLDRYRKAR